MDSCVRILAEHIKLLYGITYSAQPDHLIHACLPAWESRERAWVLDDLNAAALLELIREGLC